MARLAPTPKEIVEVRSEAGLTQDEAARMVHVTTRTWQSWERGRHHIKGAAWELLKSKIQEMKK